MYICKTGYLVYSRARGILRIQTRRQKMELETDIEKYFKRKVEKKGAWCPKWTSPGIRGVPDRLVFLPNGKIATVEMKRPKGGVVSKSQMKIAEKLRGLGHSVWRCYTKEEADYLIFLFEELGWL